MTSVFGLELVARVFDKAFLFLDTLFYRSEYHPGKDHYQQKDVFAPSSVSVTL